ncbi:UNVERIFIED_CONTAM: hypothetical protein RMT77_013666 [Armadillidium vulgare]
MLRLKPFALVFLLCLSVCENSRIKRAPQLLGTIINGICGCPEPPTCPETTTCSETSTCPVTPTCPTCPDNKTCPISGEEMCAAAGAYYCEFNKLCITRRFAATTAAKAIQKCSNFSDENVNYSLGTTAEANSQQAKDCLSVAFPASGVSKDELFWEGFLTNLQNDECFASFMTINGDEYIEFTSRGKKDCTEEFAFFCLGNIK